MEKPLQLRIGQMVNWKALVSVPFGRDYSSGRIESFVDGCGELKMIVTDANTIDLIFERRSKSKCRPSSQGRFIVTPFPILHDARAFLERYPGSLSSES